ncbi:unnamed protein product [Rotaria sordida]|uniref:Uncharacterized protein n=1 Tax=Rotaria sordida TaxID=392033 RepID=A0A813XXR4_9BILA|nr:unnamed protein product [Rotaria sordida]CAF0952892.1 unnamed protein product [Rotaria sordida]
MKGACVLDIDLNETRLKVTIQSSCHPQYISIDVMSVRAEEKNHRKTDILRTSSTVDIPVEEFRSILDTNIIDTFFDMSYLSSSFAATLHGHPFMSTHAANKGAIVAFTKSLACEYLLQDVRMNVIAPVGIDTPMNKNV